MSADQTSIDRLSELLPQHIRRRDAEGGGQLRALLAVIAEQVGLVEADIERLYENWFIETCDDWAVPYIGDLVGYRMLRGYAEALQAPTGGGPAGGGARLLAARLAPRRDVAATLAARRRKGTLPLLEELAAAVAEWPARAVEFHRLLARDQDVRLYGGDADAVARRARQATELGYVDVRHGGRLDLAGGPFDPFAHLPEAPRITSRRRQGRYGPPAVGLFVWRLGPYSITHAPAYCVDRARNLFTFSILANDTPLVTRPVPEPSPDHIAEPENVPAFISRRALQDRLADFYGPDKSFAIWRQGPPDQPGGRPADPIPLSSIVVADLTDWAYRPRRDQVVVDPELGRIAFGARAVPRRGVWVTYHYAFADAMGGGEYLRDRTPVPATTRIYRVGPGQEFERITDAYERWKADDADGEQRNGIIEITHSGSYQEQLEFVLDPGESLELRAAEGTRPTLRLLDWYSNRPDSLQIRGTHGNNGNNGDSEGGENGGSGRNSGDDSERAASGTLPRPRFRLDGLLITGRGVSVTGPVGSVSIRHSTLVPGWSLEPHCAPTQPEEPSLVLEDTTACVQIDHSILGTILVITDEVHADPLQIHIADSILDATGRHREALSAPECRHAHAILHAYRTTVIGEVHTHAVQIGEDSIFDGHLNVARRGIGCLRFCYVQPGSRTPRRYHCQPDLVWVALREQAERGGIDPADLPRLRETEAERVRPQFTSRRYGTPAYGQLAAGGPAELARGAEDGAELGLYHNLFQPQREDNLRARLVEFAPAGTDAGIVFVT